VMQAMKKDLEKPRAAVRSPLKAMKGFPCFEINFLHQVLRFRWLLRQQPRSPVEGREMPHCRGFEFLHSDLGMKEQVDLQRREAFSLAG